VVTEDDLIAALMAEPSDGNPHGARTMVELVAGTGVGRDRLCKRLHALQDAGQLGVTKIYATALDGRVMPRVAYYYRKGQ